MSVADNIRALAKRALPSIEQWLDAADEIKEFREQATESGLDWSQLKAALVAKVRDDRDGGDRLSKLASKADNALTYADALASPIVAENKKNTPQSSKSPSAPSRSPSSAVGGEPASASPQPPIPQSDVGSTNSRDDAASLIVATSSASQGAEASSFDPGDMTDIRNMPFYRGPAKERAA